jgi:hypothetical protein
VARGTAVLRIIKGGGPRDNLEAGEAIVFLLGVAAATGAFFLAEAEKPKAT